VISREDVAHVRAGPPGLTDAELETMREQLNAILAHIDALKAVDTTGIEPTSHAVPQFNVMREDEPRPCFPVEEMLANAPDRAATSSACRALLKNEATRASIRPPAVQAWHAGPLQ